jgi:serine/threonine protein kinase
MKKINNIKIKRSKHRYSLIKKIGSGGHSVVFLAKSNRNCFYAIKVFCRFPKDEQKSFKFFAHEYKIYCLTKNIPGCYSKVLDVIKTSKNLTNFDSKNTYFGFVFKYYNFDLRHFVLNVVNRKCFLAFKKTLMKRFVLNLLGSVRNLHHKRIVHGDLKPENILINKTGEFFCISDFSSSFIKKENQKPVNKFFMTRSYRAPERFIVDCKFDGEKLDVYSLACILYFIFSNGQTLFTLQSNSSLEFKQRNDMKTVVKKIAKVCSSKAIVNLLLMMLHPNTKKRYNINQCIDYFKKSKKWKKSVH